MTEESKQVGASKNDLLNLKLHCHSQMTKSESFSRKLIPIFFCLAFLSSYHFCFQKGRVIPELNLKNYEDLRDVIGGCNSRDVTGGMATKVQNMIDLCAKEATDKVTIIVILLNVDHFGMIQTDDINRMITVVICLFFTYPPHTRGIVEVSFFMPFGIG